MFENIEVAPPDPIIGLMETFEQDPRPEKMSLCAGVYGNNNGETPIFKAVKEAERRILSVESTKHYHGIPGTDEFRECARELVLGASHEAIVNGRAVTVQTPGGTGGVRVAADFLKRVLPSARVWISDPTWVNHHNLFQTAGFETMEYPYFDPALNALNFEAMVRTLNVAQEGDVVLLHGCCHNPSGIDPTQEQWDLLVNIVEGRKLVPVFDFAYQGFGDGLNEDAAAIRKFCESGAEVVIASSFSKNFGIYRERVGALTVLSGDSVTTEKVLSQVKAAIRGNYSSPPSHGAAVVSTILGDADLKSSWSSELMAMRERIYQMRRLFSRTLSEKGASRDFSFIIEQKGMFSFTGLTINQVTRLREEHAIYIVGSGRMNVAGLTTRNIDRVCEAFVEVLG